VKKWRQVAEVARWEFWRFFKLKEQLVSLLITLALAAAGYGVARWARGGENRPSVVCSAPRRASHCPRRPHRRRRLPAAGPRRTLRAAVAAGKLDGVVRFDDGTRVTLTVRRPPRWGGRWPQP